MKSQPKTTLTLSPTLLAALAALARAENERPATLVAILINEALDARLTSGRASR